MQEIFSPDVEQFMSVGEKNLVKSEAVKSNCKSSNYSIFETRKDEGIDLIKIAMKQENLAPAEAKENYNRAAIKFKEAFTVYCNNAPETLIYLNNARIGLRPAYVVAVPVPITENDKAEQPGRALMMLRGFALAQKEINDAGGINGVPLKLIVIDDRERPEVASKIATNLAKKPEVLAVIGHWTSNISLEVAELYKINKLVFITPISISDDLSNFTPYVFRVNATSQKGSQALANQMLNEGRNKALIAYDFKNNKYSRELRNKFVRFVSTQEIIGEIDLSSRSSMAEFNYKINQAVQEKAALVLFPGPGTVDAALDILKANNGKLRVLGDMANLYDMRTLRVGSYAEGMILAPSWNFDSNPGSDFTCKSKQLWGGREVSWAAAMSYNAAKALIEALRRNPTNPTRDGIQQVLANPLFSVQGVSDKFSFSKSGDANTKVQVVKVQKANPSPEGTGYKFLPISKQNSQCKQRNYWTW